MAAKKEKFYSNEFATMKQQKLCIAVDNMIRKVFNVAYADQVMPWEDSGCEITLPEGKFRIQPHDKGWQLREPSEEDGQVVWGYVDHEEDVPGILKALANQILMLKMQALD